MCVCVSVHLFQGCKNIQILDIFLVSGYSRTSDYMYFNSSKCNVSYVTCMCICHSKIAKDLTPQDNNLIHVVVKLSAIEAVYIVSTCNFNLVFFCIALISKLYSLYMKKMVRWFCGGIEEYDRLRPITVISEPD